MLEPALEQPTAPHYYAGISAKVGSIVNFFNEQDAAMKAWDQTQRYKIDSGSDYKRHMTVTNQAASIEELKRMLVRDEFHTDGVLRNWETDGKPEILALITPARSYPMGEQAGTASLLPDSITTPHHPILQPPAISEVASDLDLETHSIRLTDRSYDHSGQFLTSSAVRWCYWNRLSRMLSIVQGIEAKCQ